MLFEMNRIGMLIEISHLSETAMIAALRTAKAPVLLINSAPSSFCNSTNVAPIPDRVLRFVYSYDFLNSYSFHRNSLFNFQFITRQWWCYYAKSGALW